MLTYNQKCKTLRIRKKDHYWSRVLTHNPQVKGIVKQVRILTPRKPNSARRQVVKLKLTNKKYSVTYIPGSGHNLRKYSVVLIRGEGPRDLPGVYSRCVRGVRDLQGIITKTKRRSIYGVQRPVKNLTENDDHT
jgi:small subunit ribosomal protein S12